MNLSTHTLLATSLNSLFPCAGDAWQHLKSFTSILKAIATAMSKMVDGTAAEADPVVWTFSKLAEELHNKHKRFNSAMRQQ